ncbi:ALK tyrosine kinase receptor-like isoform X1 [Pomacea canaliculata]|uniref:ALK tyrosine kinase receptor-like isoform X1 n=1 Tax=Pomacea canaliculata TaxID=400727 RepID=UPI000D72526A|nr:ALK tyrosine kinase receptor-like isoform X1 [Pomacea canaliculata]
MAGGGAGNPFSLFVPSEPENHSHTPTRNYPQEWINVTGRSFSGRTCPWTNITVAMGGFGGGIGACGEYGGYGGGHAGWPSSAQNQTQGKMGSFYVSPSVLLLSSRSDHPEQSEHGFLELHLVDEGCQCDYLCMWPHAALTDPVQCLCKSDLSLANDGSPCEVISRPLDVTPAPKDAPVGFAIVMAMSLIPIVALIAFALFVVYTLRYGSMNGRLLHVRICIMQCLRIYSKSLSSEPLTTLPARVIEANPLYDLTAGKITDQKLPEIPRDNLRLSEQLGQGAFGEVYKGFLSGMSGTEREVAVAVKTLPPLCNEQTELDFFMEAYIIRKFNHPNIVRLLGVCFDDHPRYIVLELLAGGNLKSFLQESRPSENKPSNLIINDLVDLARDIAAGCSYLEKNHFIHRDIAARNCLLTTKGPERVAKLADFGMSRDVYRSDYYRKEGRAFLPIKWMPPEAFTEGIFTTKTDVWSYGVVLWEIFSMGCMPYPGLNNTEVMNFLHIGGRLVAPHSCPQPLYELMLSCWMHRAEERPDFDYILQTLNTISQDTATMLQHPPLVQIPPLCGGKGIKLLNHPVPALREDSPVHRALSDSSLEPLLKSESIL